MTDMAPPGKPGTRADKKPGKAESMLNLLLPRADRDPRPNAKLFLSATLDIAPSVAPPRAFTFNFGNLLV